MQWHKIFEADILTQSDFVKQITVKGKKFCAIKNNDQIVVTQAYCPHAGAGLAGGWCEKGKLVCPFHRYEYDLQTGRGAPGQGDYIEIYQTEIKEDGVYLGLKEKFAFLKAFFKRDS